MSIATRAGKPTSDQFALSSTATPILSKRSPINGTAPQQLFSKFGLTTETYTPSVTNRYSPRASGDSNRSSSFESDPIARELERAGRREAAPTVLCLKTQSRLEELPDS